MVCTGRNRHCQPKHIKPGLLVHMGSRFVTCVQSNHRPIHERSRHLAADTDRPVRHSRGNAPTDLEPERFCEHRRPWCVLRCPSLRTVSHRVIQESRSSTSMRPPSPADGVARREVSSPVNTCQQFSQHWRDSDGPALRSTAIITYANWLLDHGNTTFVSQTLWPIVKLDLDYVNTFWNQSGSVRSLIRKLRYLTCDLKV